MSESSDRTPSLWLSHHPAEQHDRCVLVGRTSVCRRCLVLYPIALAVMLASVARWPAGESLDPLILLVLPLPAVVEWWLEHLGRVGYSPRRQIAVTIPLAFALGRGLARYLDDPLDPLFWLMVLGYGGSCAAIALWRFLDDHAP